MSPRRISLARRGRLRATALALCVGIPAFAADDPADLDGCRLDRFVVESGVMGRDIEVAVLLPPAYSSEEPSGYPVLFALHGRNAPHLTFSRMAALRGFLREHPMIVVSFQADKDSFYVDATHRASSLFTTFFFDELVPKITATYHVDGQFAVTGFSMGGFGALHYALQNPSLFASVSAMSGAFEMFDDPSQHPGWAELADDLMGPGGDSNQKNLSLRHRLADAKARGICLPPLLLTCGSGDFLKPGNLRFVELLSDPGWQPPVRYEYRETPGGHDWPYWRDTIRPVAEFHWEHFRKP